MGSGNTDEEAILKERPLKGETAVEGPATKALQRAQLGSNSQWEVARKKEVTVTWEGAFKRK